MAFCRNCGTQIQDEVKFCPSCGQDQAANQKFSQTINDVYQVPIVPDAPTQDAIRDAQTNKTMAIISYILFFIPLLTGACKASSFVKYHTNQGTALFISAVIWGIVYAVLSAILIFIPYIGWGLMIVLGLTGLIFLVFCIIGIINAANGKMKPLPLIGKINIIK